MIKAMAGLCMEPATGGPVSSQVREYCCWLTGNQGDGVSAQSEKCADVQERGDWMLRKKTCALLGTLLVIGMFLGVLCSCPSPACAKNAYNWGFNYREYPYYDVSLADAAVRASYWQAKKGYAAGLTSRSWATNISEKMMGDYSIISVYAHSMAGGAQGVPLDPDDASYSTCIYSSNTTTLPHSHKLKDMTAWVPCRNYVRVQSLASFPTADFVIFQGCNTAEAPSDGALCLPRAVLAKGAATGIGFLGEVKFGGAASDGYSYQWHWSDAYWQSLYNGRYNSQAMDDGAARVKAKFGTYGGYDTHARWGLDSKI